MAFLPYIYNALPFLPPSALFSLFSLCSSISYSLKQGFLHTSPHYMIIAVSSLSPYPLPCFSRGHFDSHTFIGHDSDEDSTLHARMHASFDGSMALSRFEGFGRLSYKYIVVATSPSPPRLLCCRIAVYVICRKGLYCLSLYPSQSSLLVDIFSDIN